MLRLPSYEYRRPASLDEALELLAPDDSLPIAGGTDLVPNMKHRLFEPARLVALKGVRELGGIEARNGEIVIGATETLSAVSAHPLVRKHLPSLAEAAGRVAGPQLRNMGTIGGNICLDTRCTYYNQTHFWRESLGFCLKKDGEVCHVTKVGKKCVAAHSADTPPVLLTLGARVDLASAEGERVVTLEDWFVADGIWNSVRRPDEIVVRVRVPMPGPDTRVAFQKLRQRGSIDFPLLNVAVAAEVGADDRVRGMRMVVSALGSRPRDISGLAGIVDGQRLTDEVVEAVAERAHKQCHPLTNIIVDPDWRRAMVPVHVRRALRGLQGPARTVA